MSSGEITEVFFLPLEPIEPHCPCNSDSTIIDTDEFQEWIDGNLKHDEWGYFSMLDTSDGFLRESDIFENGDENVIFWPDRHCMLFTTCHTKAILLACRWGIQPLRASADLASRILSLNGIEDFNVFDHLSYSEYERMFPHGMYRDQEFWSWCAEQEFDA